MANDLIIEVHILDSDVQRQRRATYVIRVHGRVVFDQTFHSIETASSESDLERRTSIYISSIGVGIILEESATTRPVLVSDGRKESGPTIEVPFLCVVSRSVGVRKDCLGDTRLMLLHSGM